jgi:dihydroorotase-like cyclic amidohydrolase
VFRHTRACGREAHTPGIAPFSSQTSHELATLPGLIEVRASVKSEAAWGPLTAAALAGGFTFVGVELPLTPSGELATVRDAAAAGACCDYAIGVAATSEGTATTIEVAKLAADRDLFTLRVPAEAPAAAALPFATLTALVAGWPSVGPIVTLARGGDLAAMLFVAGLHDRRVHVSQVTSKEDIQLICAAKRKNSGITCDVSLYSLLFTSAQFVGEPASLPADLRLTADDQAALWQNLDAIDVFTAGTASALDDAEAARRLRSVLVFALSAVAAGRLKLEDLMMRFHENPARIFGRPAQTETSVVVEVDRVAAKLPEPLWAIPQRDPAVQPARGYVSRVVLRGRTVFLDGRLLATAGEGQPWRRDGTPPPAVAGGLTGGAAAATTTTATATGLESLGVAPATASAGTSAQGVTATTAPQASLPLQSSSSSSASTATTAVAASPAVAAAADVLGSPRTFAVGLSGPAPALGSYGATAMSGSSAALFTGAGVEAAGPTALSLPPAVLPTQRYVCPCVHAQG